MTSPQKEAKQELLPCPFCGKENAPRLMDSGELGSNPGNATICCDIFNGGCGAADGYKPTEEEAIELWNTRASIKPQGVMISRECAIGAMIRFKMKCLEEETLNPDRLEKFIEELQQATDHSKGGTV